MIDAYWGLSAPMRILDSPQGLVDLASGRRSYESFLVALDGSQEPYAKRFETGKPLGPWIVKGGPGSGKSTLALYCVRNLVQRDQRGLRLDPGQRTKILFTTFTNALKNAAAHTLKALLRDDPDFDVHLETTNRIAVQLADVDTRNVIWNAEAAERQRPKSRQEIV